MNTEHPLWQEWAQFLHRWGLQDVLAICLEAAGPLTLLGAQLLYLSQPLLRLSVSENRLNALAALFEDPAQSRAFAVYLREEKHIESDQNPRRF